MLAQQIVIGPFSLENNYQTVYEVYPLLVDFFPPSVDQLSNWIDQHRKSNISISIFFSLDKQGRKSGSFTASFTTDTIIGNVASTTNNIIGTSPSASNSIGISSTSTGNAGTFTNPPSAEGKSELKVDGYFYQGSLAREYRLTEKNSTSNHVTFFSLYFVNGCPSGKSISLVGDQLTIGNYKSGQADGCWLTYSLPNYLELTTECIERIFEAEISLPLSKKSNYYNCKNDGVHHQFVSSYSPNTLSPPQVENIFFPSDRSFYIRETGVVDTSNYDNDGNDGNDVNQIWLTRATLYDSKFVPISSIDYSSRSKPFSIEPIGTITLEGKKRNLTMKSDDSSEELRSMRTIGNNCLQIRLNQGKWLSIRRIHPNGEDEFIYGY